MSVSPYVSSAYFKSTGGHLFTLLLVFAVVLGFLSGSIWFFTASIGALIMVKFFPILLALLAIGAAAFLTFKYYYRK
jgi:hypothetical protein